MPPRQRNKTTKQTAQNVQAKTGGLDLRKSIDDDCGTIFGLSITLSLKYVKIFLLSD